MRRQIRSTAVLLGIALTLVIGSLSIPLAVRRMRERQRICILANTGFPTGTIEL